jgi:phosphate transport system protein
MLNTEIDKLQHLKMDVINLGLVALDINKQILTALEFCDTCKLHEIKLLRKDEIYTKANAIDTKVVCLLALYGMEAKDLRLMVSYLKITNEMERILTRSRTFIRDFPSAIVDVDKDFILEYAVPMQRSAVKAIQNAVNMLVTDDKKDIEQYYKNVVIEESNNDDLYKIIEKNILKKTEKELYLSKEYQNILLCMRRIEKVADRALSMAILLHYAKIGGKIEPV